MANNIWTNLSFTGAGSDFQSVKVLVEGVIETAQSTKPRRWIQTEWLEQEGSDVTLGLMTIWDRGESLVAGLAQAVGYDMSGKWKGECDPPNGEYSFTKDEGVLHANEVVVVTCAMCCDSSDVSKTDLAYHCSSCNHDIDGDGECLNIDDCPACN